MASVHKGHDPLISLGVLAESTITLVAIREYLGNLAFNKYSLLVILSGAHIGVNAETAEGNWLLNECSLTNETSGSAATGAN